MTRITDKSFVYTPSFETDLKKKFRMIIERQRRQEREHKRANAQTHNEDTTVVSMSTQSMRSRAA